MTEEVVVGALVVVVVVAGGAVVGGALFELDPPQLTATNATADARAEDKTS